MKFKSIICFWLIVFSIACETRTEKEKRLALVKERKEIDLYNSRESRFVYAFGGLRVRDKPSLNGKPIGLIPNYEIVKVIEEKKSFFNYRIHLENGRKFNGKRK